MTDLSQLIERAETQIRLGKITGSHTGSPHNIYQIAEELVDALRSLQSGKDEG